MAISPAAVVRRLCELIAALDRRTPRADDARESAIARDAAVLREKAVARLTEIATQTTVAPDDPPDRVRSAHTAFPATPSDVAALTVQEFTFDLDELDGHRAPSIERVCRTFMDDANRALVWWIRFGALKAWCTNPDVIARSTSDSWILRDACTVAAGFPLNHLWEFDSMAFGRIVDGMAARRARVGVD